MTTHFITAEVAINENQDQLVNAIQTELERHGQPLRWAITQVDQDTQTAHVEAVVTKPSATTQPA
ncbi:MAG: hypothetical protein ACK456_03475 [Pseudanabaenaceae cyanobacterium]|jgi:hypothetical protein